MNTTRAAAAVLEAIQALNNGGVEHELSSIKPLLIKAMICENVDEKVRAIIVFESTWRELGFCECHRPLEDRRYKECEKCRK